MHAGYEQTLLYVRNLLCIEFIGIVFVHVVPSVDKDETDFTTLRPGIGLGDICNDICNLFMTL